MSASVLNGNTLTIRLPDEIAAELAAMTAEERDQFAVAALASALAGSEADAGDPDDPVAVAEIGAALAELEAAEARGDRLLTLDEVWAHLEQSLVAHRKHRGQNGSSPGK
jgi:hypothetical protein